MIIDMDPFEAHERVFNRRAAEGLSQAVLMAKVISSRLGCQILGNRLFSSHAWPELAE